MGFSIGDLASIMDVFNDEGFDLVVIGDTVVQLALRRRVLEGDVDVYGVSPSPLVEEERYARLAERMGWGYGYTEIGTPRITAGTSGGEIVLEVYENFMDIEIPIEILSDAGSIRVGGVRIRLIKPEEYFVLKARQGVDLDKISRYREMLKRVDTKLILRTIKYYPRNEQKLILERLRTAGFRI